jgi:hypothetical protein
MQKNTSDLNDINKINSDLKNELEKVKSEINIKESKINVMQSEIDE